MAAQPFLGEVLTRDIGVYKVAYLPRASVTTGISSKSFSVTLPKNAVVRRFDVLVGAERAQQTDVEKVAQVRAYSASGDDHVVIDFGVPRTVSAITVNGGPQITGVSAWTGAAFGRPFFASGPAANAVFASEVRSERLLVQLSAAIPAPLGANIVVELPDPPSDLEIRINGGAPVFTNPGPVEPSMEGWNAKSQRTVDLAAALNALVADPLSNAMVTFELTLTTKVPGVLTFAEQARSLSFINRIAVPQDTLDFPEEGAATLPLALPASAPTKKIEEIRLTLLGNLPPERVLPPVGPAAATAPDGSLLAELVLDPQRAACVRLSGASNLAELTAIRLPLAAGAEGAEANVVLWENGGGVPSKPMPNGASKPATLAAAPADTWTRFAFAKPVPIDADNPPWAAVLVSRGTATWPLSSTDAVAMPATPDAALAAANELRRGAPNGPWQELPAPLQSTFMHARGRVRMAGNAAKSTPVDPLLLIAFGMVKEVTPTAKGVTVTLMPNAVTSAAAPPLFVVSRAAGTVTVRDVDVIWSPANAALPSQQTLSQA